MRIALVHGVPSAELANARAALQRSEARWIQFGDEMFLYSSNVGWRKVVDNAMREVGAVDELPGQPRLERLQLVLQKGRTFQLEHPDIPILMDKGRYLVAEIDPKDVERLVRDENCFAITPLGEDKEVFNQADVLARRGRGVRSAAIDAILRGIDLMQYRVDRMHLVDFGTRLSSSTQFSDSAEWAAGELTNLGYVVSTEQVVLPGGAQARNVIADKHGTGAVPRRQVLIFAHLDSVNSLNPAADAPAPGADDNASGAAAVLAIARALRDLTSEHDLRFILFGGEEQGLLGSRQYVNAHAATLPQITAAIDLDMIASLNTPTPTVLLEGGNVSRNQIDRMLETAATYTNLEVQTSLNPFASDHVPFIEAGVPAVLTIEGADDANDRIHTDRDTLDSLNDGLAFEIVRLNTAFAALELGLAAEVPGDTLPPHVDQPAPVPGGDASRAFQFSGRYTLGSVTERSGRAVVNPETIHDLPEPIFLEDVAPQILRNARSAAARDGQDVSLVLRIDFDGEAPLDIVSGAVEVIGGTSGTDGHRSVFIGRITEQRNGASGPELVVQDFAAKWPMTGEIIDRLDLALTGGPAQTPEARATFTTVNQRQFGAFRTRQISQSFRSIELEVDIESQARNPEPYDTHTHPDRPPGSTREILTLESTFAKAGIEIRRSPNPNEVASQLAGADRLWTNQELHDAMENEWSRFDNIAQNAMWIFLARHHVRSGLGGIMFDADIFDVGGVDRQGTAVFTENEHFHKAAGAYCVANPPASEAAMRELFFNLIHETGHAINLLHSFQKSAGATWDAPSWMPVVQDPESLSWMNYPDAAAQTATGSNTLAAKWFYDQFQFAFDDNELLFLRHAPQRFVQMGGVDFAVDHGRIARSEINRLLEITARVRKPVFELGEPVVIELKLANRADRPVEVSDHLDACDGSVEVAITGPDGSRKPFVPFFHARERLHTRILDPDAAIYAPVSLVVGKFGLPFKHPGAYRIEVSYRGPGGTTAAVLRIFVAPARHSDDLPVVNELFHARVGRVLAMHGSREMEEELNKLDWVLNKMPIENPVSLALRPARVGAFSTSYKRIATGRRRVVLEDKDPDTVVRELSPVVENMETAADTIGHIEMDRVVDSYTQCAVDVGRRAYAGEAQKRLVSMYHARSVIKPAIDKAEARLKELT